VGSRHRAPTHKCPRRFHSTWIPSARQFKLQLLSAGLLDEVEAFVASQNRAVQISYENSNTFVRTEPMMASGFTALGFSEDQIDAFFVAAAKI
jgi:hypothetical protein